ncbi:tRNA (guanosine-2'-O-)-methyltransferase [Humidesulfovibrio mexicanus]|uniref:tRNA (guanosine(18)-2'-O)-methyltransferase n=1 Tax=Humidesulfovibrio mexicanus TaxID=147047 RepID=A0A239BFS4_9BACT|nr:RNA methyltransferase [Humidesulfovibrio mexicanus]SNS06895.1 tRNA (guanosine-2'-O-)-methyltransferase [Humidesulfovibrio mexicanus]
MRGFITPERLGRIRHVLSLRQKDVTLVMDNIWDPHNVSAILRSCDAFGIFGVHLYYTTEKWPDLGEKSSASAKKWVERTSHSDAGEMLDGFAARGMQVIRTGFSQTAKPLHAFDFTIPTAVILSNEHRGASPELTERVEQELYIPMQGMVQSLNVSVAAAVILYEMFSQRRRAGLLDSPSLSPEELARLELEWSDR